jgi:hypothetical protein
MKHLSLLGLLFLAFTTLAQDGKFNFGARSAALGGASLTIGDEYSLFNNVGGLGLVENHAVFAGYQNRFGVSSFQTIGAGAVYTTDIGNAGVGFYKFGDDLYSQQRIHLAIGNKIQMVSLGLGVDLLQYNISTVGSRQVIALQFGGIAEITEQLVFGAHIFNLNQAKLHKETGERVPTVMKGGVSYRPSDELMINLEVEKDLDFAEVIKVGIEYQLVESVYLRTGISTEPFLSAFGIGFHPKHFKFDYAYSNDSDLGSIHDVTISYLFK